MAKKITVEGLGGDGKPQKEKVLHQDDYELKLSRWKVTYLVDKEDYAVDHFDGLADEATYKLGPPVQQQVWLRCTRWK